MALPKLLKNINLFADGRNFMGKVTEMTPPKLKTVDEDYTGGGMAGVIPYTMGYEKLEASFSLAEYSAELLKLCGLVSHHAFSCNMRGYVEDEQGNCGSIEFSMRGKVTETDLGTLKPREKGETKYSLALNYYEMKVDGEQVHYIDVMNNVWLIGGVDQMAAQRTVLDGGSSSTASAALSALAQYAAVALS